MTHIHPAWLAREQRRWLRLDRARFQKPQYVERKYSPDQPRVPAGNSRGGQWTSGRTSGGGLPLPFSPDSDAFADAGALDGDVDFADVVEDAAFEEIDSEGEALAEENTDLSSVRRRTGTFFVNGQWLEATPAQLARFLRWPMHALRKQSAGCENSIQTGVQLPVLTVLELRAKSTRQPVLRLRLRHELTY